MVETREAELAMMRKEMEVRRQEELNGDGKEEGDMEKAGRRWQRAG